MAIKFFDSQFNKNNDDLRKRFKREAYILAEIQHPSIPYVITHGEVPLKEHSVPYIVMQYIDGTNLDDYIYSNLDIAVEQSVSIISQVTEALIHVHTKNIIHRDIKPANIMLSNAGHCYLIDFSIGYSSTYKPQLTRTTRTGDHLGSAEYMSPEQNKNMKSVDQRSDIYSLGLVLCKLLTGAPDTSLLDRVEPTMSVVLKDIIKKACAYKVEGRFNTADEFLSELKAISSVPFVLLAKPSKAICNNTKCDGANWSDSGYYKGSNFIEECTDIHCTSCGNKLIYSCGCGYPIANTPFCGGCDKKLFEIPECESCGSYLKKQDMDENTKDKGCSKCHSRNQPQQFRGFQQRPPQIQQVLKPVVEVDEDIPF